ncbi:MAG: hypothetical protein OXG87_03875 [Gemmatimonadetes bacterium]|nr:hypothetical protein [Gemmatimonadota bacterium]
MAKRKQCPQDGVGVHEDLRATCGSRHDDRPKGTANADVCLFRWTAMGIWRWDTGWAEKLYAGDLYCGKRAREVGELHCGIELTEGQEWALLDETAGQLARTLEALELEMQLLQSARLVSLGQMAADVAHELNQPLTVVETTAGDICLRLIEGLPLETDELREMMEDVRGVVDRLVDYLRYCSQSRWGDHRGERARRGDDVQGDVADFGRKQP